MKKKEVVDEVKANNTPSWGRMLTKKELLDMLDRIYAKQKDKKEK
jgi:hypothetical protein